MISIYYCRAFIFALLTIILSADFFNYHGVANAKTIFVTIGTGGISGVYYPTGGAISRMINGKRKQYKVRALVESTEGSVYNVNAIMAGNLEFGIVQSDRQYQAWKGMAEWESKGHQRALRSVFSIHTESISLVASEKSNIKKLVDLKGKRVNIGNPGSGQRQNAIDILQAIGLNYKNDIQAEEFNADDAPGLLQNGRIDAFFYTVGHPSGALKEATTGAMKVRFIPISGKAIDSWITTVSYYTKSNIPIKFYPEAINKEDVPTVGMKATFVTSIKVPVNVVYAIVKEVFDNLEKFKKLHPAYALITKESMLEGLTAPLHPGALKYFQEIGFKP